MKTLLIVPALLLSIVLAGCTTGKTVYYPDTTAKQKTSGPTLVVLTGSRIPRRVDLDNPNMDTLQPVKILSGEEYRAQIMRR